MTIDAPCEWLPWDTEFFGHTIARIRETRLDAQQIERILEWCTAHEIECLYFLADLDHPETTRLAEEHGFHLADIRIALECSLGGLQTTSGDKHAANVTVRTSLPTDIPFLQAIARSSYTLSRFYYDPQFPTESCHALYETWIRRSCEGYADNVLLAEMEGALIGYISCHLSDDLLRGRIGLVGVASHAKGSGVGRVLVEQCLDWFNQQGVEAVDVVTQGRNIAAQRLYQRCGFLIRSAQVWYHKWLPV